MRARTAIAAIAAALLLAGCERDAADTALPPPAALTSEAMGVFCGMNLLEHPGPKGQIITRSRIDPFWFSSVRDTVAFTLLPEQPRDIRAIYVSDMGKAPSWDKPGADNWVDARQAFFIVDSDARGGMGAAEAVPFSTEAAAAAFVKDHGGRVVRFDAIPRDYILEQQAGSGAQAPSGEVD